MTPSFMSFLWRARSPAHVQHSRTMRPTMQSMAWIEERGERGGGEERGGEGGGRGEGGEERGGDDHACIESGLEVVYE